MEGRDNAAANLVDTIGCLLGVSLQLFVGAAVLVLRQIHLTTDGGWSCNTRMGHPVSTCAASETL